MNLSLSNFTGAVSEVWVPLGLVWEVALGGEDLGAPKKEVREASFLGFLRSEADRGSALRLVDIGIEILGDLTSRKKQLGHGLEIKDENARR